MKHYQHYRTKSDMFNKKYRLVCACDNLCDFYESREPSDIVEVRVWVIQLQYLLHISVALYAINTLKTLQYYLKDDP